jgi:Fur family ferric uptake transcriptional regulator
MKAHYHPSDTHQAASPSRLIPVERATRQRAAIREALQAAARPLLPDEVLLAASAAVPGLGIATVYRNLKLLVEEGELRAVALPGENLRYERAGHHHHHFQCKRCQRVFDVHACPGDLAGLAPAGFVVQDHELTLYGLCGECAAPPARKPVAARSRNPRSRPAP